MKLEQIQTAALVPQARNANKMEASQFLALKSAIQNAGFLQPIVVSLWEGRHHIVDGHHRVKAANELKMDLIPAYVGAWSPEVQELLALGLNKNRGKIAENVAEQIIVELYADGFIDEKLLTFTGYSKAQLDAMLVLPELPAPPQATDVVPDVTPDVDARPFKLTLSFATKAERDEAKRLFKEASGGAKDVTLGAKNLLGMTE